MMGSDLQTPGEAAHVSPGGGARRSESWNRVDMNDGFVLIKIMGSDLEEAGVAEHVSRDGPLDERRMQGLHQEGL